MQAFQGLRRFSNYLTVKLPKRLASLLKGLLCHVNLIPLNEVSETGLKTVDLKKAYEFQSYLNDKGIPCTIRRELGEDIDAACGQLRLSKKSH